MELRLPELGGRQIAERGTVHAAPLLRLNDFARFCADRNLRVDERRLLRLEQMGLFRPIFRVRNRNDTLVMELPDDASEWFDSGRAWDTTRATPTPIPESQAYYSQFQIIDLGILLQAFDLHVPLDGYFDVSTDDAVPADQWARFGERWSPILRETVNVFRRQEHWAAVALMCQLISDRYYFHTRGNGRTIQVSRTSSSDEWTLINGHKWDWRQCCLDWRAEWVGETFGLTRDKLKQTYESIAVQQDHFDPIEDWYKLVQFVKEDMKQRLKGDALRAATYRAAALMLRKLHKDLYGEELRPPNEVAGVVITHTPELAVRGDKRRYLEFVVNQFDLNPRPKLTLFVEGRSEEETIRRLFPVVFGAELGDFGIELIALGGVDTATGSKKEDRFRAIFRLVDYLHHHQTIAFLILDNEHHARRLKAAATTTRSVHYADRLVTRRSYVKLWRRSFELDNYTDREIAAALDELGGVPKQFSPANIKAVRSSSKPGADLKRLFEHRTGNALDKLAFNRQLVERLVRARAGRTIPERPVVRILTTVAQLAVRNPFPTMQEIWEHNQASSYLGTVSRSVRRRTRRRMKLRP